MLLVLNIVTVSDRFLSNLLRILWLLCQFALVGREVSEVSGKEEFLLITFYLIHLAGDATS